MSWATQGQIRLLERRLMRLADQSEKVLAWVEQRRELLDQMERHDLGHGEVSPAVKRVRARKRGASADPERLEELQRQAEELRLKTAVWWAGCGRRCSKGLGWSQGFCRWQKARAACGCGGSAAPSTCRWWCSARAALEEGIALMQPPVEGTPPAVVAPVPEKSEKRLLSVKEAAALLTISTKKLYRMAALMQIRHVRLGRSLRFEKEELERWLQQQATFPRRR
jgi:excisionase family DNA binding protein